MMGKGSTLRLSMVMGSGLPSQKPYSRWSGGRCDGGAVGDNDGEGLHAEVV